MKHIHIFAIAIALLLPAAMQAQGVNVPRSMTVADDGNIFVAGNTLRPDGTSEVYLLSLDRNGELQGAALSRGTHSLASEAAILGNTIAIGATDVQSKTDQEMHVLGFDRSRIANELEAPLPNECSMSGIWPNPIHGGREASIDISIGSPSRVLIDLYAAKGNVVVRLIDTHLRSGQYTAHFETKSLPNGTYFCMLTANGVIKMQKVEILR